MLHKPAAKIQLFFELHKYFMKFYFILSRKRLQTERLAQKKVVPVRPALLRYIL